MSKQYDSIGASYNTIHTQPAQAIQHSVMRNALLPICPAANVLDLACGTGYYSHRALTWGATSVTGLDISASMISAATLSLPPDMREKATFHVADCAALDIWDEGGVLEGREGTFDIVIAAWFLNYASSGSEMQAMFSNVYRALKTGGKMVALTIWPEVIDQFVVDDPVNKEEGHYGIVYEVVEDLLDGGGAKKMRLRLLEQKSVMFEWYYFGFGVYEGAAGRAGMGELEWEPVLPDGEWMEKMVGLFLE
jgi:SAM-dependent methyltransferase